MNPAVNQRHKTNNNWTIEQYKPEWQAMTRMQIKHWVSVTPQNKTLAPKNAYRPFNLLFLDKTRFSTSWKELSFATENGYNTQRAWIPNKERLMIPVIDQQCRFTQYLSASNNDARVLKLASSSLAATNFSNLPVTCCSIIQNELLY